jgi:hypothetical protein
MVLAQSAAAGDSARIFSRTLGGSMGTTAISSVATDSSGSVIVAGTTSSFDFPVTNGSVNSGTAIAESFDAGKTWKPLGNLPAGSTYVLARDASIPPLLFAGGTTLLLSSYIDAGSSPAVAADEAGGAWVGGANGLSRIGAVPDSALTITGAGNSFTGRNWPLSGGEFATITLRDFQPDQTINLGLNAPLPTSLEGVRVLFDGEPAAIVAVGPGVVVCLTPYDLAGKISTVVQVRFYDQVSTALIVDIQPANVGLLSADYSGQGQAFRAECRRVAEFHCEPGRGG